MKLKYFGIAILALGILYYILIVVILKQPVLKVKLNDKYSRDLLFVYTKESNCGILGCSYYHEIVKGADNASFTVIDNELAKDKNHVYCGQRLDNVDAKSFHALNNNYYADNNSVRQECLLIVHKDSLESPTQNFDPDTFEDLGCNLRKDKTGVYMRSFTANDQSEHNTNARYDLRIDISYKKDLMDPATIKLVSNDQATLGACILQDKNFEYTIPSGRGIEITNSFQNSATDLGCGYTKTAKGVFFNGNLVPSADPDTFKPFHQQEPNACNSFTFASDKNHIFVNNRLIEEADRATFTELGLGKNSEYAYDNNYYYVQGISSKNVQDKAFAEQSVNEALPKWKKLRTGNQTFAFRNDQLLVKVGTCNTEDNVLDLANRNPQWESDWIIGSKQIQVSGISNNSCQIKVQQTFRPNENPSLICNVPTSLKEVTISYQWPPIKSESPFRSISTSFAKEKYCN